MSRLVAVVEEQVMKEEAEICGDKGRDLELDQPAGMLTIILVSYYITLKTHPLPTQTLLWKGEDP